MIPVIFNTFWLFISTSRLRKFCLIKFKAAPVSIMHVGFFKVSMNIIIDGILVDFGIFIFVVWLLEVGASGFRFMLSSVHPCWEELWSFPDELFVIGYLVVSCSILLIDRVFYSNCKLFQYNLNYVKCYYDSCYH